MAIFKRDEEMKLTITDQTIQMIYGNLSNIDLDGSYEVEIRKVDKQRTPTQNRCMHKFCNDVAEAMNDQGITFNMFFNPGFEMPWTKEIYLDNVWRVIQKAITGHDSTTRPTPKQYIEIYEILNRKHSEFGFHVPWPNRFGD
jgi:hypothetical protein